MALTRSVDSLIDLIDLTAAAPVPAALAGCITERAPRVVVVGDALLDGWLSGPARRLDARHHVLLLTLSAFLIDYLNRSPVAAFRYRRFASVNPPQYVK